MTLLTAGDSITAEISAELCGGLPAARRERFVQLIEQLQRGGEAEQVEAARILWRFGAPALDALVEALRSDAEPVRIAAVESLGKLADPRAVRPIVAAVTAQYGDRVLRRRRLVGFAAGSFLVTLLFAMTWASARWLGPAAGWTGLVCAPLVGPLFRLPVPDFVGKGLWSLSRIAEGHGSPDVACRLREAVIKSRFGRYSPAKLAELLQDTLGELTGPSGFEIVVELEAGSHSNLDPLRWLLTRDSVEQRVCAVYRLAAQPEADRQAIHDALSDPEARVRSAVASALGLHPDTKALPLLLDLLKDKLPEVRAAAAEALGQVGDERAIGPLQAALRRCFHRGSGRGERFTGGGIVAVLVLVALIWILGGLWSGQEAWFGPLSVGMGAIVQALVIYLQQKRASGEEVRAIAESLAWIGEQIRRPELRDVLNDLSAAAQDRVQQDPATRRALRSAAERIDRMTADLHRLPVSSSAPEDDRANRPLPADSHSLESVAYLPRAAEARRG